MDDRHSFTNGKQIEEKRSGIPTRRVGLSDDRDDGIERRFGLADRRTATDDKNVTIITCNGEYRGSINLNAASERVDRVSDFFIKSDIAFLTLYNATVKGQTGKVTLLNIKDIAVVIPHDDLFPRVPELRRDVDVNIRLNCNLGQIIGKVNLLSETREVYRVSDLLNYPGKRWLVLYEANLRGRRWGGVIVNLDFVSAVEG